MNNIENQTIINEVVKRIKRSDFVHQIKSYLKSQGLNEAEADAYYLKGKEEILNRKMKKNPIRYQLLFGLLVIALIGTIIAFSWILQASRPLEITKFSLIGSAIFYIILFLVLRFFGSWKPERIRKKHEKKKTKKGIKSFVIALIPAIIMYFVFAACFQFSADYVLKETMISTTAIITKGVPYDIETGKTDQITFEFQTNKGEKITLVEDVLITDFHTYYQDVKIPMIYSSENPQHHKLLTDDDLIKEYLGIDNRDLLPTELISFFSKTEQQIFANLNANAYGWEPIPTYDKCWSNPLRAEELRFFDHSITYITPRSVFAIYSRYFEEEAFKLIDEGKIDGVAVYKIYESKTYNVTLKTYGQESPVYSVEIKKR